jgi:hypothetical protein
VRVDHQGKHTDQRVSFPIGTGSVSPVADDRTPIRVLPIGFSEVERHASDVASRQPSGCCLPQCAASHGPANHRSLDGAASHGPANHRSLDGAASHGPANHRSLDGAPTHGPANHRSLDGAASHDSANGCALHPPTDCCSFDRATNATLAPLACHGRELDLSRRRAYVIRH